MTDNDAFRTQPADSRSGHGGSYPQPPQGAYTTPGGVTVWPGAGGARMSARQAPEKRRSHRPQAKGELR
ncbi:hypothetical protein AB0C51_25635, partial [Streptomyces pathocidini]